MRAMRTRPPSTPPTIAPVSLVPLLEGFESTGGAVVIATADNVAEVEVTVTDELLADGVAFLELQVVEVEGDSVGVVN